MITTTDTDQIIARMAVDNWRFTSEYFDGLHCATFSRYNAILGKELSVSERDPSLALAIERAAALAHEAVKGWELGHWEYTHEMSDYDGTVRHWCTVDGRVFNGETGREEHDYKPIGAEETYRRSLAKLEKCERDLRRYLALVESGASTTGLNGEGNWEPYRRLPPNLASRDLRRSLVLVAGNIAMAKAEREWS